PCLLQRSQPLSARLVQETQVRLAHAARGALVLPQEDRWERIVRQAVGADQRAGRRAAKRRDTAEKRGEAVAAENDLWNREQMHGVGQSAGSGDGQVTRQPSGYPPTPPHAPVP